MPTETGTPSNPPRPAADAPARNAEPPTMERLPTPTDSETPSASEPPQLRAVESACNVKSSTTTAEKQPPALASLNEVICDSDATDSNTYHGTTGPGDQELDADTGRNTVLNSTSPVSCINNDASCINEVASGGRDATNVNEHDVEVDKEGLEGAKFCGPRTEPQPNASELHSGAFTISI